MNNKIFSICINRGHIPKIFRCYAYFVKYNVIEPKFENKTKVNTM